MVCLFFLVVLKLLILVNTFLLEVYIHLERSCISWQSGVPILNYYLIENSHV